MKLFFPHPCRRVVVRAGMYLIIYDIVRYYFFKAAKAIPLLHPPDILLKVCQNYIKKKPPKRLFDAI